MAQGQNASDFKPIIIGGPCTAESYGIMDEVAAAIAELAQTLGFTYFFKASFDKANRSSFSSYRGPGMETALGWLHDIKTKYKVQILTDIHETHQVKTVAEVADVLQIPAFLCRQTDLLIAALETGKIVNVKKGQFLSPSAAFNIVEKAWESGLAKANDEKLWLTERGVSFGYGTLVVDMTGLKIMAESKAPLIFDITHSTQLPAMGGDSGKVSGARREFAPLLARSAAASGYLRGFFLEIHPDPRVAKSDALAQLSIPQAHALLKQVVPLWKQAREFAQIDAIFH